MVRFYQEFFDFLFPERCVACNKYITNTQRICTTCLLSIRYISPPVCLRCGIPFNFDMGSDRLCGICLTSRVYFNKARAIGFYEGVLQEVVHRFKYNGKTLLAGILGALMLNHNLDSMDIKRYDFLVPVPLHRKRLKERGFNQALSLARYVGKRCGVPVDYLSLKRVRWEEPQINLNKNERTRNVKGAFSLNNKNRFQHRNILLIDDVYTSGATVNECAKVLTKGGAAGVDVLTVCRAV